MMLLNIEVPKTDSSVRYLRGIFYPIKESSTMGKKVRLPDGRYCYTENCKRHDRSLGTVVEPRKGLSVYGTERIGISAELAIADTFGNLVNPQYRQRGVEEIQNILSPLISPVFSIHNIPKPIKHIAENQNPHDFLLEGNKTLSSKSNFDRMEKVAPQLIGQPTSQTAWGFFADLSDSPNPKLLPYNESKQKFKEIVLKHPGTMLTRYWEGLFSSDYMIYFSEFRNKDTGLLSSTPKIEVFHKLKSPEWNLKKITFTKTLDDWNESNTIKYDGVTLGEFQIHNNRDCFKFRFNMQGLKTLKLL